MWIEVLDDIDNSRGFRNLERCHDIFTTKNLENFDQTVTLYVDNYIVMNNIPVEKAHDALNSLMYFLDEKRTNDAMFVTREEIENHIKSEISST